MTNQQLISELLAEIKRLGNDMEVLYSHDGKFVDISQRYNQVLDLTVNLYNQLHREN